MRTIKAYEQWYECLQEISLIIEPYLGDDISSINETIVQDEHKIGSSFEEDGVEDPYEQSNKQIKQIPNRYVLKMHNNTQMTNIRNILRENLTEQQKSKLKQTTNELTTPFKNFKNTVVEGNKSSLLFQTSSRRASKK